MKNRFLIITFSLTASLLTSCQPDTEALFDQPAAERMNESLRIYRELLTTQTNGWLVEYYPERTQKYGGFNLYFRFDGNNTTVQSEINPAVAATSTWSMGSDMGPTINFDTYNTVLHYFSDPELNQGGGRGLNYEGDYEFYVESGSENEFILRGKKTKNIIRMTPMPANISWNEYSGALRQMSQNVIAPAYKMTVGNSEISIVKGFRTNSFTLKSANETVSAPFIVTLNGIKFYEPVTIANETFQFFTFNDADDKIVSTAGNAEITFTPVTLSNYFIDVLEMTAWYFKTDDIGQGYRTAWNTAKSGLENYNFRLAFMCLGKLDSDFPTGINVGVWDEEEGVVWWSVYAYDFATPSGNQVRMNYNSERTGADGINANYFAPLLQGFTINAFNGRTFTLQTDVDMSNPKNMAQISEFTLIDGANQNNWVKLGLEETLWP